MAGENKEYVVGKGELYFDKFADGTLVGEGERYMGNTPELTMSGDQSTLDHYDSDNGLNVKDESVVIEDNKTGTLVTDNISVENIGLMFGSDPEQVAVASATALIENHTVSKKGRWVQLGVDEDQPMGARNITNFTLKIGSTTVTPSGNYEVDLINGRYFIEADAPGIVVDDVLIATYDQTATQRQMVVEGGSSVAGSLRFLSKNPVGPQTNYFWPYVKLTLNGDFALKGDEWQQIPFTFEVLQKTGFKRVYAERV